MDITNKSIKKALGKLISLSLRYPESIISVEFHVNFGSVWLMSPTLSAPSSSWRSGDSYHEIIYLPKSNSEVKNFECEIEKQMAYLVLESSKLTKRKLTKVGE